MGVNGPKAAVLRLMLLGLFVGFGLLVRSTPMFGADVGSIALNATIWFWIALAAVGAGILQQALP